MGIDDMIDTGHTLKEAIETLRKFGASGVHFLATHGIFSGSSIETILLNTDFIRKIVVTNTVPRWQIVPKCRIFCKLLILADWLPNTFEDIITVKVSKFCVILCLREVKKVVLRKNSAKKKKTVVMMNWKTKTKLPYPC